MADLGRRFGSDLEAEKWDGPGGWDRPSLTGEPLGCTVSGYPTAG